MQCFRPVRRPPWPHVLKVAVSFHYLKKNTMSFNCNQHKGEKVMTTKIHTETSHSPYMQKVKNNNSLPPFVLILVLQRGSAIKNTLGL